MVKVQRYDAPSPMQSPEITPEGWMRCEGVLTRAGIFTYFNPDGTERRELRLPEEVFRPDSMGSFSLVPLTDNHPPSGWLDGESAKQYSCGAASAPTRDGDNMRAKLLITDAALVAKVKAGKSQLSNGYFADLEMAPGIHNGERYDAIQRNIRGNHVAIVDCARAGAVASIKLDSAGNALVPSFSRSGEDRPAETSRMIKITIDGVSYDAPEQTAQVVEAKFKAYVAEIAKQSAQASALTAEAAKASGRADAVEAKLAETAAQLKVATDPATVRANVSARVALVTSATKILGDDAKLDDKSAREIQCAVIAHLTPSFKADGRSDEYVQARYDGALAMADSGEGSGLSAARVAMDPKHADDGAPNLDAEEKALAKLKADSAARWRTPLQSSTRKQ